MRRPPLSLCCIALLSVLATALPAQARDGDQRGLVEVAPTDTRHGLFFTGSLGDGMEQYQYSDQPGYTNWFSNPAFAFRIGGTPSPSVRLGAEFFAWSGSVVDTSSLSYSGQATETFTAFLLTGQYYPALRAGFYVKGGLGIAHSGTNYDYIDVGESGFGWTVGAGWDIPLSRSVFIGPVVDFYQGSFTELNEPTITEHVLNIGASVTFQSRGRWW